MTTQTQASPEQLEADRQAQIAQIKARIEAEIAQHEANEIDYGGLLEFIFDIYSVEYTFDANYNKGQSCIAKCTGLNRETGAEVIQFWSVGKDMQPEDGGQRIIPTRQGAKGYHASSTMGQIVHKLKSGEYGYDAALDLLPKNLMTAAPWAGTSWQMRASEIEIKDRETAEVKKFTRSFPAEWLGRHGGTGAGAATPAPAAPTYQMPPQMMPPQQMQQAPQQFQQPAPQQQMAPPVPQQAPAPLAALINPQALAGLVAFAKGVDRETFVAQAANFDPGIYQSQELLQGLTSGALYLQLRG